MTDINHLGIIGRLTKPAEERKFDNGSVINFSIAVNRSKKQGDQWVDDVSFFNVRYNVKSADKILPRLTKGTQVVIEGYLKQDRWEKDGQKNQQIIINCERLQIVGSKSESSEGGFQEDIPYENNDLPF